MIKLACMGAVLALGWIGPIGTAKAAELIAVEHERCAMCLRFDATTARRYDRTPQGRQAQLRRINIARGMPDDIDGIRAVPTFILRDKGREIGRFEGYGDQATFYRRVDALLARVK